MCLVFTYLHVCQLARLNPHAVLLLARLLCCGVQLILNGIVLRQKFLDAFFLMPELVLSGGNIVAKQYGA